MKLLLKGHGVRIPFPEIPGVKLRIVFFDTDEGRKQFRTNIIVLFGYRVGSDNQSDVETFYADILIRKHFKSNFI